MPFDLKAEEVSVRPMERFGSAEAMAVLPAAGFCLCSAVAQPRLA
jgi:hypothetical protein